MVEVGKENSNVSVIRGGGGKGPCRPAEASPAPWCTRCPAQWHQAHGWMETWGGCAGAGTRPALRSRASCMLQMLRGRM